MIKIALFGVFCLTALAVSYKSYVERDCLRFAAWALTINWAFFVMPWVYSPIALGFIGHSLGMNTSTEDGWAFADLIALVAVMRVCRNPWWAPLIWSPYIITLAMLSVAYAAKLQYTDYEVVLDAALTVQIAVIFIIGGRGGVDFLSRCRDRVRNFLGARLKNHSAFARHGESR